MTGKDSTRHLVSTGGDDTQKYWGLEVLLLESSLLFNLCTKMHCHYIKACSWVGKLLRDSYQATMA